MKLDPDQALTVYRGCVMTIRQALEAERNRLPGLERKIAAEKSWERIESAESVTVTETGGLRVELRKDKERDDEHAANKRRWREQGLL